MPEQPLKYARAALGIGMSGLTKASRIGEMAASVTMMPTLGQDLDALEAARIGNKSPAAPPRSPPVFGSDQCERNAHESAPSVTVQRQRVN